MKKKYGVYGGQYAPEILMPALKQLEADYSRLCGDEGFRDKLNSMLTDYAGRPTPLYFAENLSPSLGFDLFLKREDLLHSGAHKINNTLGQVLVAKQTGRKRVIAETGAGQHGVATAIAAAKLGLECEVYMGAKDVKRQSLNVFRMELMGAHVKSVESGSKTLKDAINEALRHWLSNAKDTFYCMGSVVGPHPYPAIVRDFQSVIGFEIKKQVKEKKGRLPDAIVACVGGGSNALGAFNEFLGEDVRLVGVEAAGEGVDTGKHCATLCTGSDGVLHGMYTKLLQDSFGQINPSHSISAGLDYPGVGPQLSHLSSINRIEAVSAGDSECMDAVKMLAESEGILPALESAHALAYVIKNKNEFKDKLVVVNLSGRGDKDVQTIADYFGVDL
ncbi:MAG: tryptophan synthase subunit beta [Candidatus Altiarchaeales archaeon]|nr:tryptophan synthase subunit beta [Candidatus Altiarchaeales archaeon]